MFLQSEIFQQVILSILTIAIITAITKLIPYLRKQNELTENKIAKGLIDEILDTVEQGVGFYNQKVVSEMKANGKFTVKEQEKVFNDVKQEVINYLDKTSYQKLDEHLNGQLNTFIENSIENQVLVQKPIVQKQINNCENLVDNEKEIRYNKGGFEKTL